MNGMQIVFDKKAWKDLFSFIVEGPVETGIEQQGNVGNLSWRPQLPPSLFGNITGEIRESEAKKGKRGKERKQKQEKER